MGLWQNKKRTNRGGRHDGAQDRLHRIPDADACRHASRSLPRLRLGSQSTTGPTMRASPAPASTAGSMRADESVEAGRTSGSALVVLRPDDLEAAERAVVAAGGDVVRPVYAFPADGASISANRAAMNWRCGQRHEWVRIDPGVRRGSTLRSDKRNRISRRSGWKPCWPPSLALDRGPSGRGSGQWSGRIRAGRWPAATCRAAA